MKCPRNCLVTLVVEAAVLLAIVWCQARGGATGWQQLGSSAEPVQLYSRFSTIPAFRGACNTVWTTGYMKYSLPYPVHFSRFGTFTWAAPYLNQLGAELGEGAILSQPVTEFHNGIGKARYFAATRFYPGSTTTCCCEYLTWSSDDAPRILTDYCRATLPGTGGVALADVCEPYSREPCPQDNATAYEQLGSPFVEEYGQCGQPIAWQPIVAAGGAWLIINIVGLLIFGLTWLLLRYTDAMRFLNFCPAWLLRQRKERVADAGDHFVRLA